MGILSSIFGGSGSGANSVMDGDLPYIRRCALDADGRDAYDRIREQLLAGRDDVDLRGLRAKAAQAAAEAWSLVIMDEPRLMRLDGTVRITSAGGVPTRLSFGTIYDHATERRRLSEIDASIAPMLEAMSRCRSDLDKAEIAYRAIIDSTDYGIDDDGNQSMDSVFLDRFSCCAGYSHAFQYALERCGVPCAYIDGYVNGKKKRGAHAWNLAVLDGKRCLVDVTWGDPVMGGATAPAWGRGQASPSPHPRGNAVRMDYLCIPASQLARTHTPSDLIAPLMGCADEGECDWYRRNGLRFDGAYDAGAVASAIQSDLLGREVLKEADDVATVDLKFTDRRAYDAAKADLFGNGALLRCALPVLSAYGLTTDGNVSLSENDEIGVLHFAFRKIRG